MMRSLYSGISGIKSHQTRMDVIGNNISNVNTVGFKSSRTTFADTLSQTQTAASGVGATRGGINPKQIGLGTGVASIDLLFTDAAPSATGKNTDLALSGNALFVVQQGSQKYYTRDGAFEFDEAGNYVLPGSGLYVQGWMADESGAINTTSAVTNITVPAGKGMAADATELATYSNNLNASSLLITEMTGGDILDFSWTPATTRTYAATGDTVTMAAGDPYTVTITDTATPPADHVVAVGTAGTYVVGGTYTEGGTDYTIATITVAPTTYPVPAGGSATASTSKKLTLTVDDGAGGTLDFEVISGSYSTGGTYTDPATGISYTITAIVADGGTATDIQARASSDKPLTLTMSDGSIVHVSSGIYTTGHSIPLTTTFTAYDSLGKAHEIPLLMEKIGTDIVGGATVSVWQFSLNENADNGLSQDRAFMEEDGTVVLPSFLVTDVATGDQRIASMGYFAFDVNGQMVTGTPTGTSLTDSAGNNLTYLTQDDMYLTYFPSATDFATAEAATSFSVGEIAIPAGTTNNRLDYVNSSGPAMGKIQVDFNGLTQYSGSTTAHAESDGYAAGTLSSIAIDTSGIITGTYTNGEIKNEAQVAVAQFTNASGLMKTGNSLYQESNNSGSASIRTVDDLGVTITPSALELSNVDVANEFSEMIVTQRGFQSNSKMVTVGDEMLETLINMKR